jgi:site-specific DNA-methyltransferase (adenine-specific)
MKDLSNNSIDLFICDLPYGCLNGADRGDDKGGTNKIIGKRKAGQQLKGCAWDIKIDLEQFWIQVKRLAKNDKTPVLMFCSTLFGADLINSNPKWFRYDLIWNKNLGINFLSANKMPMRSHEMIYVFSKKGANYNRIDEFVEGKEGYKHDGIVRNGCRCITIKTRIPSKQIDGKRCPLSVINIHMKQDKRHPTAKPQDLYEWLIKRYSNEGDTILDPTAGSFNSGKASINLNRNYIGIEKDLDFFNKNKI